MAGGESATGISNARYNLVSVPYHALEGGATYDKYIQDAENESAQELADFFRQVQQEDAQRASRRSRCSTSGRARDSNTSRAGILWSRLFAPC